MPAVPHYVQRVARLPEVLRVLATYPAGLTVAELAEQFGIAEATLREDLATYLELDSWGYTEDIDIFRLPVIEFVTAGEGGDGSDATVVRVVDDGNRRPTGIGVEYLDAAELAHVYTAGQALLEAEPGNDDLAEALAVVAETMFGAPSSVPSPARGAELVETVRQACTDHRRLRIVYSRSWHEGVDTRSIEPLRMVSTRRGWEVDAGPVHADGGLRTYLLSHVRDVRVLDETFEPPARLDRLLAEQRATTTVRLRLPQEARYVVDMYAEQVAVVDEDEDTFTADLELLAPVGRRVGLMLLAGGPWSALISPGSLNAEAAGLLSELLAHHESPPA
jgi:predicted DNA-binding transcriptional regulator YafY